MDDTLRDVGVAGFCLMVMREAFAFMKRGARDAQETEQTHADRRLETAIMNLAESVRTQVTVLEKAIETQNQILSEIRREQFDQKASLARLEAKIGH